MLLRTAILVLSAMTFIGKIEAKSPGAQQALARLIEGNERYVKAGDSGNNPMVANRASLVDAQHPYATVLTCSDSRVTPEYLFDEGLGNLFVVRVAGNVLDSAAIASLEYGAEHLRTPLLVILGHQNCGAVNAAINAYPKKRPGYLGQLLSSIYPAVKVATAKTQGYKISETLEFAIEENVRQSRNALIETSPVIQQLVNEGTLKIVTGVYQLDSGRVKWID